MFYPELLSCDSTNVYDRDYVPKSKRWTKVQSVITWFNSKTQGMEDISQGWQTSRQDTQTQSDQKIRRGQNRTRPWPVLAMASVATQAEGADSFEHQMTFDTDSSPIGVDNRCTGCISHRIEDFEVALIDTGQQIKGFGDSWTSQFQMGTLIWKWQDNQGRIHKFKTPKSF